MKRPLIITAALLALAATAGAQETTATARSTSDVLTVGYSTPVAKPGSDRATIITPMICSAGGDTLRLDPVVYRGKRNARKLLRDYVLNHKGVLPPVYTPAALAPDYLNGTAYLPLKQYPWARSQQLTFVALTESEGCCEVKTVGLSRSEPFAYSVPFTPVFYTVTDNTGAAGQLEEHNPVLAHVSKYRPYDSTRILRKEKGALYVHFPLDKTTLRRDFRDNDWRLDRICDLTRQIMADTTSSVAKIQIIGLASVEGTVKHNHWLASNRARALKDYVQQHVEGLTDDLFDIVDGGEAWTEFRDQISDVRRLKAGEVLDARELGVETYDLNITSEDLDFLTTADLDDVLAIIDTEPDLDRRELRLRRAKQGEMYWFLQRTLLADQRNSGYVRIYWDYVPDRQARIINEATGLMGAGRYADALERLRTVEGDDRAWNALGTCLYMLGHEQEAIGWFRRAAARGNADARRNLEQLE